MASPGTSLSPYAFGLLSLLHTRPSGGTQQGLSHLSLEGGSGCIWMCTLSSPLPCGRLFSLCRGCYPGRLFLLPLQASLLTTFYSCSNYFNDETNAFLFHVTANSRPSMLSLTAASPGLAHRARADGKPRVCWMTGGLLKRDSSSISQMHAMF